MRYYPIFLDLRGRRCAVVGGGPRGGAQGENSVALGRGCPRDQPRPLRRAWRYWRHGKKFDSCPVSTGRAIWRDPRPPRRMSTVRLTLIFAATNSPPTQAAVRKDAEALGVPVNVSDDAEESSFIVPASFAQGDLLVAISTSGASPALARQLRRQLQLTLGCEYRAYLRFLRDTRKHVMATVPDKAQRAKFSATFREHR